MKSIHGVDSFLNGSYLLASNFCRVKRFHRRRKTGLYLVHNPRLLSFDFEHSENDLGLIESSPSKAITACSIFSTTVFLLSTVFLFCLRILPSLPLIRFPHFRARSRRFVIPGSCIRRRESDGFISSWIVCFKSIIVFNEQAHKKRISCLPSMRKNALLRNIQRWGMRTLAECLCLRCHVEQPSKKLQRLDGDFRPADISALYLPVWTQAMISNFQCRRNSRS